MARAPSFLAGRTKGVVTKGGMVKLGCSHPSLSTGEFRYLFCRRCSEPVLFVYGFRDPARFAMTPFSITPFCPFRIFVGRSHSGTRIVRLVLAPSRAGATMAAKMSAKTCTEAATMAKATAEHRSSTDDDTNDTHKEKIPAG